MGFRIRLGGWRPVELEEGDGELEPERGNGRVPVAYRLEVWHQMVDGFHGPFRTEGAIRAHEGELRPGRATLTLADGRRVHLHLGADGSALAHQRPEVAVRESSRRSGAGAR